VRNGESGIERLETKYIELLFELERRLLESIGRDLMPASLSALMEVLQNTPVDWSFCCRSMTRAEIQRFWWRLVCNVDTWQNEEKCSQHLLHGNAFLAQKLLNKTFPWLLVCMDEGTSRGSVGDWDSKSPMLHLEVCLPSCQTPQTHGMTVFSPFQSHKVFIKAKLFDLGLMIYCMFSRPKIFQRHTSRGNGRTPSAVSCFSTTSYSATF
jgi:hypothetical protein